MPFELAIQNGTVCTFVHAKFPAVEEFHQSQRTVTIKQKKISKKKNCRKQSEWSKKQEQKRMHQNTQKLQQLHIFSTE